MLTAMTVIAGALALVVLVLTVLLARVGQQLRDVRHELGEDRSGRSVIVLDVRNAADLAAQRTRLARALSSVAPGVTRSLVHRELVRRLRTQLTEEGVHADISVRRWAARRSADATDGPQQTVVPAPTSLPAGSPSPAAASAQEPLAASDADDDRSPPLVDPLT